MSTQCSALTLLLNMTGTFIYATVGYDILVGHYVSVKNTCTSTSGMLSILGEWE